jgi:hypothetical protein
MSPLDLSVQVHFRSSGLQGLEISVLKLKPHYNIPGALDLLTSVSLPIDVSLLFGSSGFGNIKFQTFPLLDSQYMKAHIHSGDMTLEIYPQQSDDSNLFLQSDD